jgi:hypothetical protein
VSAAFTPDVLAPLPDAAELTDDACRWGPPTRGHVCCPLPHAG